MDSPLGTRAEHIDAALATLARGPSTRLVARSRVIHTAPVGPVPQGEYLNAAAVIETTLDPDRLLARLLIIERDRGRDRAREGRWGPRTLDLDLLLFEGLEIDRPGLTIPHPRLAERAFVLIPLAEIAPDWIVPGKAGAGRSVADLLQLLPESARAAR